MYQVIKEQSGSDEIFTVWEASTELPAGTFGGVYAECETEAEAADLAAKWNSGDRSEADPQINILGKSYYCYEREDGRLELFRSGWCYACDENICEGHSACALSDDNLVAAARAGIVSRAYEGNRWVWTVVPPLAGSVKMTENQVRVFDPFVLGFSVLFCAKSGTKTVYGAHRPEHVPQDVRWLFDCAEDVVIHRLGVAIPSKGGYVAKWDGDEPVIPPYQDGTRRYLDGPLACYLFDTKKPPKPYHRLDITVTDGKIRLYPEVERVRHNTRNGRPIVGTFFRKDGESNTAFYKRAMSVRAELSATIASGGQPVWPQEAADDPGVGPRDTPTLPGVQEMILIGHFPRVGACQAHGSTCDGVEVVTPVGSETDDEFRARWANTRGIEFARVPANEAIAGWWPNHG